MSFSFSAQTSPYRFAGPAGGLERENRVAHTVRALPDLPRHAVQVARSGRVSLIQFPRHPLHLKFVILVLILLACTSPLKAASRVVPILRAIDANYKMKKDIRADVTLTQQRAGQGTRIIGMAYFRRDSDDAFLMAMNSPENEKGNGYLRVGDNFWMYRKNTRTFQHVNRDESIGGSDAHSDDFETRKLEELYGPVQDSSGTEIFSEEMLGKVPVNRFEIKAKVNDVDYPRQIFWTRRENNLLLKQESYSLSGTLMQTAYFLKFTEIEGRFVPVKQLFIDEFEKGNRTIVEISNIVPGGLDDKIFTKAYLENLSK